MGHRHTRFSVSKRGFARGLLVVWTNDPDNKGKFASVLMAMSLNLGIGLGISGCFNWGGGIPIVYRVDVVE